MTNTDNLQTELNKITLAYQEALQNSRIKAGFLGRVAHEIRSPLSSLMGLHQLIINDLCDSPEEERHFIEQAYQYAKKSIAMIDQVIEVSKLEIGRINLEAKEFNLSELLDDIYNIISLEATNKSLRIDFPKENKNLNIKADKTRLANILFFLLEVVIDVTQTGVITLNCSENKNNQECLIKITFLSKNFSLKQPDDITFPEIPLEELKRLHTLPEFSNQMKIMLAEALLEMMGGNLKLETDNVPENQLMELYLSLPFEIV
jgi:signal transduction histidine kinase